MNCHNNASHGVPVVDIELFSGNTRTIVLDLRSGDSKFELPGDGAIHFVAKRSRHDEDVALSVSVGPSAKNSDGCYEIPLSVTDTSSLSDGQYQYDIGVQWGNNFVTVVEGTLIVRRSIAIYKG